MSQDPRRLVHLSVELQALRFVFRLFVGAPEGAHTKVIRILRVDPPAGL